jgi:hypothetical protein
VTCSPDPTVVVVLAWSTAEDAAPLYVGPDCASIPVDPADPEGLMTAAGIWWTTLTLPARPLRYTYLPESRYVPGRRLTTAVQDISAIAMSLAVHGTDLPAVQTARAAVDTATAQTTSVRILDDGDLVGEWPVMPTLADWDQGGTTPQASGLRVSTGGLVIPANPQAA